MAGDDDAAAAASSALRICSPTARATGGGNAFPTCRYCAVSLADEPHLLLEVDHIVPLSRGGLSTPENLQTLCWRCNRSKSNKMPQAPTPRLAPEVQPPTPATSAPRAGHPEAPPVAPNAASAAEIREQLSKLRELYDAGLFTDAEYEAKRAKLLARYQSSEL